jgi:hypothetical protein
VWGLNDQGQLGDGGTTNQLLPVRVANQVVDMAGGAFHTLVRLSDGSLLGAGLNDRGQLGDGTLDTPRLAFVPALAGLTGVDHLSASGVHSLALTEDGDIWATGQNNVGQLGNVTMEDSASPTLAAVIRGAVDVAAGRFVPSIYIGTATHSVALTDDGRVWTWGSNSYGMLGTGGPTTDTQDRPRPVEDFSASDQSWPLGDPDGDGLLTKEELQLGTDPFNADSNGDGITDYVAVHSGLDALSLDVDGDGVSNAAELGAGTDPLRADTDGDGVLDGADCFPLDPLRSQCLAPNPNDHTPPDITLSEPTTAVLLTSTP